MSSHTEHRKYAAAAAQYDAAGPDETEVPDSFYEDAHEEVAAALVKSDNVVELVMTLANAESGLDYMLSRVDVPLYYSRDVSELARLARSMHMRVESCVEKQIADAKEAA